MEIVPSATLRRPYFVNPPKRGHPDIGGNVVFQVSTIFICDRHRGAGFAEGTQCFSHDQDKKKNKRKKLIHKLLGRGGALTK